MLKEMLDENDDVTLKNVQCERNGKKIPLQEIKITLKEGNNEYETKLYYGGFKYTGILENTGVEVLEIKQIAIISQMDRVSTFECSSELIYIFYDNIVRSCPSNFVDIPTDCPTRERMGWTGDSQIIFDIASYLFDCHSFFRKHLKDVFDRQDKDGRFPQIAPYSAEDWYIGVMNGLVGWANAGILIPYHMYLQYGNMNILKNNYDNMVKYEKFMINRCGRGTGFYVLYIFFKSLPLSKENKKYGINCDHSYGEWTDPEESMAYTSYVLSIMIEISNIIGRTENNSYSKNIVMALKEPIKN